MAPSSLSPLGELRAPLKKCQMPPPMHPMPNAPPTSSTILYGHGSLSMPEWLGILSYRVNWRFSNDAPPRPNQIPQSTKEKHKKKTKNCAHPNQPGQLLPGSVTDRRSSSLTPYLLPRPFAIDWFCVLPALTILFFSFLFFSFLFLFRSLVALPHLA